MRRLFALGLVVSIVLTSSVSAYSLPYAHTDPLPAAARADQELSPRAFLPFVAKNWLAGLTPPQMTDQNGEALFHLTQGEVKVRVEDEIGQPLSNISVQLCDMQEGVLSVAADPNGDYFPGFGSISHTGLSGEMSSQDASQTGIIEITLLSGTAIWLYQTLSPMTNQLFSELVSILSSLPSQQWYFFDMIENDVDDYMLIYSAEKALMYMRVDKAGQLQDLRDSCVEWRDSGFPNPFLVRATLLPFAGPFPDTLFNLIGAAEEAIDACTEVLYYDDGRAEYGWATGPLGGAAVLFTPRVTPWTLSRIRVAGWYVYSDAPFYIEIWDSDRNELLRRSYTYSQFFDYGTISWAEIDIPDVVVNGDFYICVFPNDSEDHILWLGFDVDPPISHRSYDVRYDTNSIEYGPHDDWDWTIRAIGW